MGILTHFFNCQKFHLCNQYNFLTRIAMKRLLFVASMVATFLLHSATALASNESSESVVSAGINDEVPVVTSTPKFSGFIINNFLYKEGEGTSFNVRNVNLSLDGNLGDNFDYKLQVAFAGSPKVSDAYGRLKFSDALNVQFGQFKLPFSLENPISPTSLETFDGSLPISTFCGGRDIGVALYGSFGDEKVAEYSVGVFNGSGTNKADADKYKDYVGRLIINTPLAGLAVSGSFHLGNPEENGARVAYNRFAAGFKYDSETLFSRAEYLWGSDNSVQASGGYGLLGYKFTPRFYGFGKYDQLYVQTKEGKYVSETNAITAGLAYRLNSKVLFRLQYQLMQADGTSRYLNNVGGAVTIQF